MIVGRVLNREPIVRLAFGPSAEPSVVADVVIDTGYTDFLTLPADLFERLAEGAIGHGQLKYADQRVGTHDIAIVTVQWDGEPRPVIAAKLDGIPLVGMELLEGYRLTVDAVEGGRVLIERLPPPDTIAPEA